jgi:hypothetical protein
VIECASNDRRHIVSGRDLAKALTQVRQFASPQQFVSTSTAGKLHIESLKRGESSRRRGKRQRDNYNHDKIPMKSADDGAADEGSPRAIRKLSVTLTISSRR